MKTNSASGELLHGTWRQWALYVPLFLLSAFLGALLFSISTSPLHPGWGYDSAMFQTIGKYWAQGWLPYVDMFDHKGPVIFLINALGYMLGGRGGVFFIQVLCLALSEYLAYRMLSLRFDSRISLLVALALPLVLSANWQEGNTTEEYILPLLFACFYHMLLWCDKSSGPVSEHSPRAAVLYGLTFAFALLTRVTNAIGLCVGVAFIVISLALGGRWKNLGLNALGFIVGFGLPVALFSLYFYSHGALYDMWYGTILYNLSYMSSHKDAVAFSLLDFIFYVRRYLCGFALLGASVWGLLFGQEGRRGFLMWLPVSFVSLAFLYTQNAYDHYGICLLPMFCLALCLMSGAGMKKGAEKATRLLCTVLAVFVFVSAVYKTYKSFTTPQPDMAYENYGDDYIPLLELIPEEGRDSFIAIDCPRRLYLENDLRPDFRFFTLQTWMGINSPELLDMICSELEQSDVEWLIMMDMGQARLPELIEGKYELVAESDKAVYKLYKLK